MSDCSSCIARFFFDNSTGNCEACAFDCLTCDENGDCLSCDAVNDFRELVGGRCQPLTGYYESGEAVASRCPVDCTSCDSAVNCTSCVEDY
jgi:hypothetical protein